jgi:hypothetical protein
MFLQHQVCRDVHPNLLSLWDRSGGLVQVAPRQSITLSCSKLDRSAGFIAAVGLEGSFMQDQHSLLLVATDLQ